MGELTPTNPDAGPVAMGLREVFHMG